MVELSDALKILTQAVQRNTQEYAKQAEDLRNMHGGGKRGEMEQRQANRKEEVDALKRSSGALDDLYGSIRKARVEYKTFGKTQDETIESLRSSAQDVEKLLGKKISPAMAKTLGTIRTGGVISLNQIKKLANATSKLADKESELLVKKIKTAEAQDKLKRGATRAADSLKDFGSRMFSVSSSIGLIGTGIARTFDELDFALKHQTEMYTALGFSYDRWSGKLGLAPLEMQKMVAEFRPLMHSAALEYENAGQAVAQSTNELTRERQGRKALYDQAYLLTGNYNDAAQLMYGTMNMLQGMGTQMKFDELGNTTEKIMGKFSELAKVTGQSSSALQNQVSQYFSSAEVRGELMKMDKTQRKNRMMEVLDHMKYQVQMGKTTQASLEAQQAMARIAGMGPKERIKEAAKLQSVMAAMGVEGSERAGKLFRKVKRTAPEQEELRKYLDNLAQAQQAGLAGDEGRALTTERLMGRLSGETQDIISKQSTQLDKGFELSTKQYDLLANSKINLEGAEGYLQEIKQFYDKYVKVLLKDPGVQLIFGAITGVTSILGNILTTLGGIYLLTQMGFPSLTGKLLTGLKGFATLGAGPGGGMVSAGGLAKAAKFAGALSFAAVGVDQFTQALNTGESDVSKFVKTTFPEFYEDLGGTLAVIVDSMPKSWESFGDMLVGKEDEGKDAREKFRQEQKAAMEQSNEIQQKMLEATKAVAASSKATQANTGNTATAVKEGTEQQVSATKDSAETGSKNQRLNAMKYEGRRGFQ